MQAIVKIVSEDGFQGLATSYVGPFPSREDAYDYASYLLDQFNGQALGVDVTMYDLFEPVWK